MNNDDGWRNAFWIYPPPSSATASAAVQHLDDLFLPDPAEEQDEEAAAAAAAAVHHLDDLFLPDPAEEQDEEAAAAHPTQIVP